MDQNSVGSIATSTEGSYGADGPVPTNQILTFEPSQTVVKCEYGQLEASIMNLTTGVDASIMNMTPGVNASILNMTPGVDASIMNMTPGVSYQTVYKVENAPVVKQEHHRSWCDLHEDSWHPTLKRENDLNVGDGTQDRKLIRRNVPVKSEETAQSDDSSGQLTEVLGEVDSKHGIITSTCDAAVGRATERVVEQIIIDDNEPDVTCYTPMNEIFTKQPRIHTGEKPYVKRRPRSRTGDLSYLCVTCGKVCIGPTHLEEHIRLHTGEKPLTCPICGKTFRIMASLNCHSKIHSEGKPFSCTVCGKTFKVRRYIKRHMESIHKKTYEDYI